MKMTLPLQMPTIMPTMNTINTMMSMRMSMTAGLAGRSVLLTESRNQENVNLPAGRKAGAFHWPLRSGKADARFPVLPLAVVRSLTAILILAIIVYVTYTFWRASTPYGDIMEMIRTQQPSIAH